MARFEKQPLNNVAAETELVAVNFHYLDALVRWAEALVAIKTTAMYGEMDETVTARMRNDAIAALREMDARAQRAITLGSSVPFEALVKRHGLMAEEVAILRLALAPTLDATFRKRIARFKDNVLLDFVDVDFILSILFDMRVDRLRARGFFLPRSRLVRDRLLTLALPRDATADVLLSQELRVPDRVINFVLQQDFLDKTVAAFCDLTRPDATHNDIVMDQKTCDEVLSIVKGWLARTVDAAEATAVVVGLSGPPGTGKSLFSRVMAGEAGVPLITVDSAKLAADDAMFRDTLETLFLDARLRGAILAFDHCEAIFSQKNARIPSLYSYFERHHGLVVLLTNDPKQLDPSLERYIGYQVEFEQPDPAQRERLWQLHVGKSGLKQDKAVDLAALSSGFDFSGAQVRNAIWVARELAAARESLTVSQDDLTSGAWAQIRADMEEYSTRRKHKMTLDDLILPDEEMKLVREVLDAAKHKTFIMTRWGFGKKLSTGKGLCCLFVGEPGTGKTLCAEILAQELNQNLYQISIPRVMSKYIGETEKNIARIFQTARANNSILLFDEADALFTTRVKVETSVDRFSNMEINLLLQEIERFDGIVLLTTNLEKNLDKAFERRIQFKIRFPFPDKKYRAKIWQGLVPKECPIDPEVDWDLIGESFELAGGSIKNSILRAAYKAARDTKRITMDHLVASAEAECKAAGRLFRGLKKDEY